MNGREIANLLRLEWQLDQRQKHIWGSMVLYVISTVYACYLGIGRLNVAATWNAIFWIIVLFAAFNALGRSFQRDDGGRRLYLYSLVHPRSVVMARTLYNALVMLVLGCISLAACAIFIGDRVLAEADLGLLLLTVALGAIGLACSLTLIAAIAARAGNGLGLVAILGFPIVLPLLMATLHASRLAIEGASLSMMGKYLISIAALDVLSVTLASILYPYLWRD